MVQWVAVVVQHSVRRVVNVLVSGVLYDGHNDISLFDEVVL